MRRSADRLVLPIFPRSSPMLPVASPSSESSSSLSALQFNFVFQECDIYPPFDIPQDACDIVLRTCDRINFHCIKIILSIASPFFREMFTLPQPKNPKMYETREGRPVIDVTESSTTLQLLLTFCYPGWSLAPGLAGLKELRDVLKAADKYDMANVVYCVGQLLVSPFYLEQNPLWVFVLTSQFELDREAAIAARLTLETSLRSLWTIPDARDLSGETIQQLRHFHARCGRAASAVATSGIYEWITRRDYSWFRVHDQFPCPCVEGTRWVITSVNRLQKTASFWMNYMRAIGLELFKTPCVATVFREDILQQAISEAKACEICRYTTRVKVEDELETFRLLLANEVGKVLLGVSQYLSCGDIES